MGFVEYVKDLRYFYKKLVFWVLVGVISGTIAGIVMISLSKYSSRVKMLVKFPGEIFLRMLKCIAVPLLASCLTSAIGGMRKGISLTIITQFLICSLVLKIAAVSLGFFGTYPFKKLLKLMTNATYVEGPESGNRMMVDSYLDLLRNMFCRNLLEMFVYTIETFLPPPAEIPKNVTEKEIITSNGTTTEASVQKTVNVRPKKDISDWEIELHMVTSPNMMGIVIVSACAGVAISTMGKSGYPFLGTVQSLTRLFFKLIKWVIFTSPVFLAFLMAGSIIEHDDLLELAEDAAIYLLAVVIIYPVYFVIILPLFYFIATRKNPFLLYSGEVILTAFSTSSSLATLPLAMEYFEDVHNFDFRLVHFVLSVGVTISKDGAVIFYAFATHLATFVNKRKLTPFEVIQLLIMAMAGSVGTPAIPYGGMAIIWIIWTSLGIVDYTDFYGTIFALSWLCDRFSSIVNLYGNCFILAVLHHYNKNAFIDDKSVHDDHITLAGTPSVVTLEENVEEKVDENAENEPAA